MINYYCEDTEPEKCGTSVGQGLSYSLFNSVLWDGSGALRVSSPLSNYQLLFLPLTQLSCLYWLYVDEVAGKASSVGEGDCAAYCLCWGWFRRFYLRFMWGSGSGSGFAEVGEGVGVISLTEAPLRNNCSSSPIVSNWCLSTRLLLHPGKL